MLVRATCYFFTYWLFKHRFSGFSICLILHVFHDHQWQRDRGDTAGSSVASWSFTARAVPQLPVKCKLQFSCPAAENFIRHKQHIFAAPGTSPCGALSLFIGLRLISLSVSWVHGAWEESWSSHSCTEQTKLQTCLSQIYGGPGV